MKSSATLFFFAAALSLGCSAPQFITFQDGKLGVNFAGYHAGIGIGGSLANGTLGGLYAEAGTPTGQSASAGLGGAVNKYGQATGGLFAGATAGNNIQAAAGLSGGLDSENSAGTGFATAQAGNRITSSGLGGHAGVGGSSGFSYSGVKEVSSIPAHNVEAEFNVDAQVNEVQPLPKSQIEIHKTIIKESAPPPVIVKEVSKVSSPRHQTLIYRFDDFFTRLLNIPLDGKYVNRRKVIVESPPPPQIVEKQIVHTHYKHKRPHHHKTAFVSGYIGGGGNLQPAETELAVDKRVDIGVQTAAGADANLGGGFRNVYRKEVSVQRNPSFFADIFNIPISTLKAVGNFLGNTAANTNISVQKSASVETGYF